MRPLSTFAPLLATIALLWAAVPALGAGPGTTFLTGGLELPAGAIAGAESGSGSGEPERSAVSADGRYIAFTSAADTLDPAVNPDATNVFRKDRLTGAVVLVSRSAGAAGTVPDQPAHEPTISDDGRWVGFRSRAALDPADTDGGRTDIYVRDVTNGTTALASVGDGVAGAQTTYQFCSYDLAGDGRWVAFTTDTASPARTSPAPPTCYRRDLTLGRTVLVSLTRRERDPARTPRASRRSATTAPSSRSSRSRTTSSPATSAAAGSRCSCATSARGTYVAVSNSAGSRRRAATANRPSRTSPVRRAGCRASSSRTTRPRWTLQPAASTRPRRTASTCTRCQGPARTLVSLADGAARANADSRAHSASISDDGTRVMFASDAVIPRPISTASTCATSRRTERSCSTDTRYAVHPIISGDGVVLRLVQRHRHHAGQRPRPRRCSGARTRAARSARPSSSRGRPGRRRSSPRPPRSTRPAAGARSAPTVATSSSRASARACQAARSTGRTGLPPRCAHGRGRARLARERRKRAPGDNGSDPPTISADGMRVAFRSSARLDPADTDTLASAYVRDMTAATMTIASRAEGFDGAPPNAAVADPRISADGQHVVFLSTADNLGAGSGTHAYLRDLVGGHTTLVDRATGVAGAIGNGNVDDACPSADGTRSRSRRPPTTSIRTTRRLRVRRLRARHGRGDDDARVAPQRLERAHATGFSRGGDQRRTARRRVPAPRTRRSRPRPAVGRDQQIVARTLATGATCSSAMRPAARRRTTTPCARA